MDSKFDQDAFLKCVRDNDLEQFYIKYKYHKGRPIIDFNCNDFEAIKTCVSLGYEKMLAELLSCGAVIPYKYEEQLIEIVCKSGNLNILKLVIRYQEGKSLRLKNIKRLRSLASKNGHIYILNFLCMDHGKDNKCEEPLICPITLEPIKSVTITKVGSIYEKDAIEKWFKYSDIDPATGIPLPEKYKKLVYLCTKPTSDQAKVIASYIRDIYGEYSVSEYTAMYQHYRNVKKYEKLLLLKDTFFKMNRLKRNEILNAKIHWLKDQNKYLGCNGTLQFGKYEGIEVKDRSYKGIQFDFCAMKNCEFTDCCFSECSFSGAELGNVKFTRCQFIGDNVTFYKCILNEVSFNQCDIEFFTWERPKTWKGFLCALHERGFNVDPLALCHIPEDRSLL